MDGSTPNATAHSRAMPHWESVIADMEATTAEYDDEGWDTVELHPGDVTPIWTDEDGEFGLDVLVPDNEFEDLEELMDGGVSFDAFEAYRALADGLVFAVIAMEDRGSETAVLYPVYYDVQGAEEMLSDAVEAGKMYSFIRTLGEDRIRFTHDDPSLFQPPEEAETEDAKPTEESDANTAPDE
ncbi:hypothetical protein [Haladaptatus sp. CMAA 1911]|uniref:DUF7529 family protein n=1 Tax=unclassified Haladaptatus TaxID=2622732 RepID=UPI003754715F